MKIKDIRKTSIKNLNKILDITYWDVTVQTCGSEPIQYRLTSDGFTKDPDKYLRSFFKGGRDKILKIEKV